MKNAITVIDQELIDWFDNEFVVDINNPDIVIAKVEELLSMAKDLIEINAEITKREQKYKAGLKAMRNVYPAPAIINYVNNLLKGDSDE